MKKFFGLKKLNNKGAGLVAVIVAIAFVSMLSSILLCTSYMNYRTKATNLRAKDSFYSAEKALDEINMGLQTILSQALSKAYLDVVNYYSIYSSDKKNFLMEDIYYTYIFDKLATEPATHLVYKIDTLKSFVTQPWNDATQSGVIVSSSTCQMVTYSSNGIVLKDLEVYYRDDKGYSTSIKTDIRLSCPPVDFGAITTLPDILDYAVIADNGLAINTSAGRTTTITGNVYGDYININNPTLSATNKANVVFGTMTVDGETRDSFVISKYDIYAKNAVVSIPAKTEIWGHNLSMESSSVTLSGTAYLSDDLVLAGNGSELNMKGNLHAYGNSIDDSDFSSAILVNGKNASIDFTGAQIVEIAGHAFVGVKDTGTAKTYADASKSTSKTASVYTGESIAVKSDQLMYLIPGECIGVANGKSLYGVNPLTASQYSTMMSSGVAEVEITLPVEKLGGKALSEYIKRAEPDARGYAAPVFEKVFVQTNTQTMVYYYMVFDTEEKANQYFKDYYSANTKRFTAYMDFYTNLVKIPDPTAMVRIQTSGSALTFDGTDSALYENTLINGSDRMNASSVATATTHNALCVKLLKDMADVTDSEFTNISEGHIVFDNLIENGNMVTASTPGSLQKACTGAGDRVLKYSDTECVALLMDNASEYVFNKNGTTEINGNVVPNDKIHLIIATGDVRISTDYTGLVLADGKVTIDAGVNFTADTELTKEALRLVDNNGFTIYQYFRDGSGFSKTNGTGSTVSSSLSELVVYENWSKQ